MKKIILVVALAVVLVFTLAATALATSAKTWNYQSDYYNWGMYQGSGAATGNALGAGGDQLNTNPQLPNDNPLLPGVHANYTTTTAKCGICHSVHRANASGVKLLNTATATCGGCHIAPSTVTNVDIAWGTVAAPLAGPHSSSSGSCTDRACHATSPHGVGGSQYGLFASKLLTRAVDTNVAAAAANPASSGVTAALLSGAGQDYVYSGNSDAVRVGYTCATAGCHVQSMLPVIKAGWSEQRQTTYPTGPTIAKTGHMTGALAPNPAYPTLGGNMAVAFAPVASCTSCHDQTDAQTNSGHTFPHAQRATGTGAGVPGNAQVYLWYNIAANSNASSTPMTSKNMKSFDGACLKCHRGDNTTNGVGLSF